MRRLQRAVWKHVRVQHKGVEGVFSQAERRQECASMEYMFKTHMPAGETETAGKRYSSTS